MVWRQFPTEIRYDLSAVHRRNIKDWHTGAMSSRELLDLIEFLPDGSAFKTALRGGDWTDEEYRQARLVNETALARADQSGYMPDLVLSPMQQHLEDKLDAHRVEAHDKNLAQLQGKAV